MHHLIMLRAYLRLLWKNCTAEAGPEGKSCDIYYSFMNFLGYFSSISKHCTSREKLAFLHSQKNWATIDIVEAWEHLLAIYQNLWIIIWLFTKHVNVTNFENQINKCTCLINKYFLLMKYTIPNNTFHLFVILEPSDICSRLATRGFACKFHPFTFHDWWSKSTNLRRLWNS